MAEYPLVWTVLDDGRPLYEAEVDLSGPLADFEAHLAVVRGAAVPLPQSLLVLLTALQKALATTAVQDPLVALKALADLRYLIGEAGKDAALPVRIARIPMETVATALGTSDQAARRYVMSYLRH